MRIQSSLTDLVRCIQMYNGWKMRPCQDGKLDYTAVDGAVILLRPWMSD